MIEKYLADKTAEISKRVLDGAKTLEEWQQRRSRLHREYLDMLGLWPLPEKTPLNATVTGSLERDGVVYRKVIPSSPPTVEYGLSALGRKLVPAVEAIARVGLELKRLRARG